MELNDPKESDNLRGGDPPKSRQSFKQKLQQVSVDNPPTERPGSFIAQLFALVCCVIPAAGCGLCCILFIFLIMNCVTIATIVIGALYKDESDCPVEKISLLLIVGGSITLVQSLLETMSNCIVSIKRNGHGDDFPVEPPGCLRILVSLLRLASLCWFIAACVKIYGVASIVSADKSSENYCHPILYLYAFWYVTVTLIILAIILSVLALLIFCACCLACCKSM